MKAVLESPRSLPKAATGIDGLDEILYGGIPEKRTTLIKGGAGTGKTVLGLEFLVRSALAGAPVMLICFEEQAEAVRQNALSMGWDLAALEAEGIFFLWEAKVDYPAVISGGFGLDSLLAGIKGKTAEMGATRIMIDAVDVLMRVFEDPKTARKELSRLHDWLKDEELTAVLTAKTEGDAKTEEIYGILDYMVDCVLKLDLRSARQVTTRRLQVVKYRGSDFCSNEYPYLITTGGNVLMPVTAVQLMHQPLGESISSGNEDLDKYLGGGYHRASTISVSGLTGTGKTTVAVTFAEHAAGVGESVLYISFEESQEAVVGSMLSPGIDLKPALTRGELSFYTIMPEALVFEEHLYRILQRIDTYEPAHVVVDAISACRRMGTDEAAFDFLVRLIDACKRRSITCLMTNQTQDSKQQLDTYVMGLASVIDTMISLRFIEADDQITRDLVIIKSRSSHHSNRHHQYVITDKGIRIYSTDGGGNGYI